MGDLIKKAQSTRSVGLVMGKANPTKAETEGTLSLRGLGVIFSRGERLELRDLEGDKFLPDVSVMRSEDVEPEILSNISTDYGLESGYLIPGKTRVPVLWDHGCGVLGKARLGWATFEKITDEGLEFLIEIERDNVRRYDQWVEYWWSQKSLGLSSQTLVSVFDYDWPTGIIRSWWPVELSLTNMPALPTTRDELGIADTEKILEIAKQFNLPVEETMKKTATPPTPVEEQAPVEVQTQPDATEELMAVVNEIASDLDKSADITTGQATLALLKSVTASLDALNARLDGIEASMAKSSDLEVVKSQVETNHAANINAMKAAFKGLGEILSSRVKGIAAEALAEASNVELEQLGNKPAPQRTATGHVRGATFTHAGIPANMPGNS